MGATWDSILAKERNFLKSRPVKFNNKRQQKLLNCDHFFFSEFFIGCIILSLEYVHNNGVLHRDIKPENLVFDDRGYFF